MSLDFSLSDFIETVVFIVRNMLDPSSSHVGILKLIVKDIVQSARMENLYVVTFFKYSDIIIVNNCDTIVNIYQHLSICIFTILWKAGGCCFTKLFRNTKICQQPFVAAPFCGWKQTSPSCETCAGFVLINVSDQYCNHVIYCSFVFATFYWTGPRCKSYSTDTIKENIKAPRHCLFGGELTGTGEFPAQRASNAENGSIWWRRHVFEIR